MSTNTLPSRQRRPHPGKPSTEAASLAVQDARDARRATASTGAPAGPEIRALADIQAGIGNAFFAGGAVLDDAQLDSAQLDGTAALLHQHTMGALAMSMAGFEGARGLSPGQAPLSVMRQVMRRNNAEDEGLDVQTADQNIGSRGGMPLPEAVRIKMERAFGHDFSHVRIHTDGAAADAADALHAVAFAIGRDIYFRRGAWAPGTPRGDELLAHELTHVVQADEGRLPSVSGDGMDVSSPTDTHEREAVQTGREVAKLVGSGGTDLEDSPMVADLGAMETAPIASTAASAPAQTAQSEGAAAQVSPDAGASVASRDATSSMAQSGSDAVRQGQAPGETYATLTIAGKQVEVKVPQAEDEEADCDVTLDERPVEGLHLTGATVQIDANGVIVGGTVRGRITIPGAFEGTQVSFGILPGGRVAPGVENVPVKIGPAEGTMDLMVTEGGIEGVGRLKADQLGLPEWVGVQGGGITIRLASGAFSGEGTLQGTTTERGTATAAIQLQDRTLIADITYTLVPGQQPIPGVVIESGVLTGRLVRELGQAEEAGTAPGAPAQDAAQESEAGTEAGASTASSGAEGASTEGTAETAGQANASNFAPDTVNALANVAPGEGEGTEAQSSTAVAPATTAAAPGGQGDAFTLRGQAVVTVREWVTGEVDLSLVPATGAISASGVLSTEHEKQFGELLVVRSSLSLAIQDNVATEANAEAEFTREPFMGRVRGTYDIQSQLIDGDATLRLTHHWPLEVDWGELRLLRGSRLDAKVKDNNLDEISGRAKFDGKLPGPAGEPMDFTGDIQGEFDWETKTASGTATGTIDADFPLLAAQGGGEGGGQGAAEGGGQATSGPAILTLLKDSVVRAEVAENALQSVGMDASVRADRDGAPFLQGTLTGANWDHQAGHLSGQGTLTLLSDIERTTRDGQWGLKLLSGAELTADVAASQLTQLGGEASVTISDDQGPLLTGTVSNARIKVSDWSVSGRLQAVTARKFYYPGEGQTLENGYSLEVLPGSGINGQIQDDALTDIGADLRTMIKDEEGSLARMRLQANWDIDADEVDGQGTLSLARNLLVAEDLTSESWDAELLRGSKGTGHIEANEFTKVTGELKGRVKDDQGEFLGITGQGEYTTADELFDITGAVVVNREKELAATESGWQAALNEGGTEATVTITDDVLEQIGGTISVIVRKQGEDFAQVAVTGVWTEDQGLSGSGGAELLTEIEVGEVGDYELAVVEGTGASVYFEADEVTMLGGTIPMRLTENGQPFMRGYIDGTYQIAEKNLSGTGRAELLVEKELGKLGDDQLWIVPSTNATATFANNQLTQVGGEMNLSTRDDEGEYGRIALEGTFDAAGGTGFTGKGSLTIRREKQLFQTPDYTFLLMPGTGATAHVLADKLVLIDGDVPFMVRDAQGDLIGGSVSGVYDPSTGNISGTGNVTLGRDLDYELGGSALLKVKQGSGGDADVVDSQLTRLGGTLTAELWNDGKGLVRVTADGSYDVVTKTLTRLHGEAELLQPIELAGGAIVVDDVVGTATIEENQLVEAGGRGSILVKPLNDMTGELEVNWSNRSGRDVYSGSGHLDFTLIEEDAETGRKMSGRIEAEYKEDDTFSASGEIDYAINEAISGKLNAEVDQNWDPIISGNMLVDTDLVKARRLFGMEMDLIPEIPVRLPYGITLFMGMRGGMGMDMDALHFNTNIAVTNWKPLAETSSVPTFDAALDLTWGMAFMAKVVPYLAIGGDIGFASAQIGARGEVILDAPIEATASGNLHGDRQGFIGELAVGVGITPTLSLDLIPYVKAEFGTLDPWEEDLTTIHQPLGELFDFQWGNTYTFGDREGRRSGPVEQHSGGNSEQRETVNETRNPNVGVPKGGTGQNVKGGPQLESGEDVAAGQQTGDGSMDQVMGTLDNIIALVEGIGAFGELAELIIGLITATLTFGPAGLIVYTVWKIFKGELSWDGIKTAVQKVVRALQAAGELLRKHMPDWFQGIVDIFTGDRPGLLDALFGADDRMRDAVRRGDHHHAPFDMHVEMVNTMKGGWLSSDDSDCIAQIFEVSAGRGELRALVSACGGADEFIDGWSTGFNDERTKRVFRANGIDW